MTTLALYGGPRAVTRSAEMDSARRWPLYSEDEKKAVLDCLESPNVYAGISDFEKEFAAYLGVPYALAHCNGSSSIHAALFAAGVGPGDEVLTSPYTWHLQVGQILALHALPVFCDIHPRTACIETEEIRRKITPRTKAIVVVHPFGLPAPIDEISEIGKERGIPVIEDCSHAHGASYKGRKVGTWGDIGCFSLQASKLMNAIEGGILVTSNARYYDRACLLGHYERVPQASTAEVRRIYDPSKEGAPACFGFKYRMHPLGAAIAREQLKRLDEWNAVRRRNMGYLTQRLAAASRGCLLPPYEDAGMERIWLNYIAVFDEEKAGCTRERFIEALNAEGLPARGGRAGYLPIYWNTLYEERTSMWAEGDPFDLTPESKGIRYERGLCPVAEAFWRRCVDLPMLHSPVSTDLLDEMLEAVAKVADQAPDLEEGEPTPATDGAIRPPALAGVS